LRLFNLEDFGAPNILLDDKDQLEAMLDEAIFDLYDLGEDDRDLINDMCDYGLNLFYRHGNSAAVQAVESRPVQWQGTYDDLPGAREKEVGLEGYLYAFLQSWNQQLEPDGEFRWRIIRPQHIHMIAIVFSAQEKGASLPEGAPNDEYAWADVLAKCSKSLLRPVSSRVYMDGIVRAISDNDMIVIKRDERRLWTRSMAREDAEAILVQAMRPRTNLNSTKSSDIYD
jgi:hypothetical protein